MLNPIVIVARNALALTKKAVASAYAQDIGNVRVVLVDNACTDGTERWWQAQPFDQPGIMCYQKQVSLAKCWNDALTCMLQISDHCLVINNDIEMGPDLYRMLLAYQQHYPAATDFVTGVSVNDPTQMRSVGFNGDDPNWYKSSPHPDFSCFLITKRVIEKVGWFDESYFPAYFEDNDYHVRMHRAGIKAVSINVPFLHHSSGTLKAASSQDKEIIERGFMQNKERFRQTYGCYPGTPEYEKLFTD